jgi:ABC-type polysaccharide/polyol phosphate transport system ATPase subunit
MSNSAINIKRVSKSYVLQPERPTLIESLLRKNRTKTYALKNITLTIQKGEKVGIVGSNGSGKTTLLKILAGVTRPTSGEMTIQGKVASVIALEAGFHPDLTGRENIMLCGMLLRMKKTEIHQSREDIIRYAGIGKYIDMPLYTYSQGMKLRLGFSVALFSNPDILLLDEHIGVGDANFKQKLQNDTKFLFSPDKTIILASHNLYAIVDFCDRVIVLENGRVVMDGGLDALLYYDKKFSYEYQPPTQRKMSKISQQLIGTTKRTTLP